MRRTFFLIILLSLFTCMHAQEPELESDSVYGQVNYNSVLAKIQEPGRNNTSKSLYGISILQKHEDRSRYSELWKKHKEYKMAGWITFSAGVGCTLAGLICSVGELGDEYSGHSHMGRNWMERNYQNVLIAGGLTITAGSIPLFVMSHKYKKRAFDVMVGTTAISHPNQYGLMANAPAVCIGVKF